MTQILICPNTFKGAISADKAASLIKSSLLHFYTPAELTMLPIADGGDGTLPILAKYFEADLIKYPTIDALGNRLEAFYGWSENSRIGIVELAEASGIRHLDIKNLNPWKATTFGTGLIIKEILKRNPKVIYLTVGGSASVDGGLGILSALGVQFLDVNRNPPDPLNPSVMSEIAFVDAQETRKFFSDIKLNILCDVENPLLGSNGSARVFGPQKGASLQDVEALEKSLSHFNRLVKKNYGINLESTKHGGAAGGVAAFLHGILGADLIDGSNAILDISQFHDHLQKADIIITGEGKIDSQTISGKGPGRVAQLAKAQGKYVVGICGVSDLDDYVGNSFDEIVEINIKGQSLESSMFHAEKNLSNASYHLGQRLKAQ